MTVHTVSQFVCCAMFLQMKAKTLYENQLSCFSLVMFLPSATKLNFLQLSFILLMLLHCIVMHVRLCAHF